MWCGPSRRVHPGVAAATTAEVVWVATLCPLEGAGLAVDPMGHALQPYYCGVSQTFFARCPLRLLLYRPQYDDGGRSLTAVVVSRPYAATRLEAKRVSGFPFSRLHEQCCFFSTRRTKK